MHFFDQYGRDLSPCANLRAAQVRRALREFHVNYPPQLILASKLDYISKLSELDSDDIKPAMTVFGPEGSGKSYALTRFAETTNRKVGHQKIIYFSFKTSRSTGPFLNRLVSDIGGDRWKPRPNERPAQLDSMLVDVIKAKRSTVLILDEVSNLNFAHAENTALATWAKTIQSDRVVSVVLSGTEDSRRLLERRDCRRRIGEDCSIEPLSQKSSDINFLTQVLSNYEDFVIDVGVVTQKSSLRDTATVSNLITATGGGFGYIIELLKKAAVNASRRNATSIGEIDLALAFDDWLAAQKLFKNNPFQFTK